MSLAQPTYGWTHKDGVLKVTRDGDVVMTITGGYASHFAEAFAVSEVLFRQTVHAGELFLAAQKHGALTYTGEAW